MTIFEQTIDTSQIQMELSFFGVVLIAFAGPPLALFCAVFVERMLSTKINSGIPMIASMIVGAMGLALIALAMLYLPPIKALSIPVYGESRTHGVRNSSWESVADTYRDEIDKSIKDKLGDYEIPEYSIDNPQESILGGGYLEKKISAVRDGKTYTLTPEWSYDKDTSTVKLDVDIEEGYHIDK